MLQFLEPTGEIYEGQFGSFTVDRSDRLSVVVYRGGIVLSAVALVSGTLLWFLLGTASLTLLGLLYGLFCLGLGLSLFTIHIYLKPLHRALQLCWGIGCLGSVWVATHSSTPFLQSLYDRPEALLLSGWVFVALTGIFFKEAFCFNRWETKFLTFLLPLLLGGHWLNLLPAPLEGGLLGAWCMLMLIFALRKLIQPIPPDLGDKSVFEYLAQQS
ncbi:DUF2301 domain-containing membrane protein [Lyngbya confervoides]|uniref:DUF2301 domain-containing membrane protein n=1 Tax=Lyngbya confervoides BDU141951 TaxID=1574623 RepID=A0ABD4T2U7_9CYAN|nr:DUF2301 domain-containing membrane protein [Lyngbya confervoides]MCM1982867.1 DUF2301 domain-containing membrane protein [Lyngbya confervoides BDU141951]